MSSSERVLEKERSFTKLCALQCTQLELTLDTTPRDSRYSTSLVELMKREETLTRDGGSASTIAELAKAVDAALNDETSKYFRKITQQNVRKWAALNAKLARDRDHFNAELREKNQLEIFAYKEQLNSSREITSDDLDLEEARLEEDYNKNWIHYEGFHLEEAFNSQKQRIERDWGIHEKGLNDDYIARKRIICPSSAHEAVSVSSSGVSSANDDRWQHPEKQKTLIHTVPAPTKQNKEVIAGSAIRAVRGSRSKEDAELDQLEKQYNSSMLHLQAQRQAALRWMNRQKIRLMAQADAVHDERVAIGDILGREALAHRAAMRAVLAQCQQR